MYLTFYFVEALLENGSRQRICEGTYWIVRAPD